jgi:dihydroflavonol-4-reductase
MRVFVTGGNGFIGSAVVRDLVTSSHHVVCLLRPTSRTERIDGLPLERVAGDVRDADSIRAGMRGCGATIHLAAPGGWVKDEASMLRDVIEGGTRNVLNAAREIGDHRVIVVSSTAAINGSETPQLFDEQTDFTVRDPALGYAHAKHRAEILARQAHENGLSVVIVNPAEVYGPGDTALGTASNLIDLATARPVLVCRGGTNVVHVADVSAGILGAMLRGRSGERYILGGENLTIRQLAELVLELVGRHASIVSLPNRLARLLSRVAMRMRIPLGYNPHVVPYATRYWFVDNAKARRELGVTFRDARETIGSTLSWLKRIGFSVRMRF